MKIITKLIISLIFLFYPLCIYLGIKEEADSLPLIVIVISLFLLRAIVFRGSKSPLGPALNYAGLVSIIIIIIGAGIKEYGVMKIYPVSVSFSLFIVFILSLMKNHTPVIETIARLHEKNLSDAAISYTRKVTIVWSIFFLVNGGLSIYTYFFSEIEIWTLYNGLISYLLIGLLFSIEYLIRRRIQKRGSST